jgi:hypothetical protein
MESVKGSLETHKRLVNGFFCRQLHSLRYLPEKLSTKISAQLTTNAGKANVDK